MATKGKKGGRFPKQELKDVEIGLAAAERTSERLQVDHINTMAERDFPQPGDPVEETASAPKPRPIEPVRPEPPKPAGKMTAGETQSIAAAVSEANRRGARR